MAAVVESKKIYATNLYLPKFRFPAYFFFFFFFIATVSVLNVIALEWHMGVI